MDTQGAEWVTLREAAEVTGKAVKTVRRWATDGKVTGQKDDSGRWHVRRADLLDRSPAAESRAELQVLSAELEATRAMFHDLAADLADARERAGRAEAAAEARAQEVAELRDRLAEAERPWWRRKSRPTSTEATENGA